MGKNIGSLCLYQHFRQLAYLSFHLHEKLQPRRDILPESVIREKSKCEGKDHSILAFNTSNRAPPRRKGSEQLLVLPWTLNDRKKFSRVNLLLTINARRTDIGIRLFGNNMKSIFQFIETVNFSNHFVRNRTSSNL